MHYSHGFHLSLLLTLLFALSSCAPTDSVAFRSPSPSITPALSSAPNQKPETATVVVKSTKANLRERPSRSSAVTREVSKSNRLTLIELKPVGGWYHVRDENTQFSGWIHGNTIALDGTATPLASSSAPVQSKTQSSLPSTSGRSYINVDGQRIPSPVFSRKQPAGATARCGDGSYSFSQHRRGTCSHHGGVAEWL